MIAPEKDEVRALVALRSNKDFEIVVRWMHKSMVRQSLDNNQQRDDTESAMTKGRNQELDEFLSHVQNAEATMRQRQETQKSTPS